MKNTETYIREFYQSIGVDDVKILNAAYISDALGFTLGWDRQTSKAFINGNFKLIILDQRIDDQQQLERFYHEIAHYILNHSSTRSLELYKYFEGKADNLIPYLAIPSHMLDEIDFESHSLVADISEKFNVSHELAYKRVEQIKDKYISNGYKIRSS